MDNNNMNYQGGQQQYGQPQNGQGYQYGQNQNQNPYGQSQQYENIQQPSYGMNESNQDETVGVGEWLLAMLLSCIPCVNIIMIFVWAFGSRKKSKSNYFKAVLIWTLIWIVIGLLVSIFAGAAMAELISEISNSMY